MKGGDSMITFTTQNNDNAFLAMMIFILVACVLLLIGFTIYFSREDMKFKKLIKNMDMLSHTIVIDGKSQSVRVIRMNRLKSSHMESLNQYVHQIDEVERPLFLQWVRVLLEGKESATFIELSAGKKRKKQNYFYRVMKVDTKNKIIHMEVFSIYYPFSKGTSKGAKKLIISIPQINARLANKKDQDGYCMCIRFYHPQIDSERIQQLEDMIIAQLKNLVYPFLNANRVVIDEHNSNVVLFDLKMDKQMEMSSLAEALSKKFAKFISINSLEGIFRYSIGICPLSLAEPNYLDLKKKAELASFDADLSKSHISIYREEMKTLMGEKNAYQLEASNILRPSSFVSKYRPIVSSKWHKIFGYYSKIELKTPVFSSIRDVKEYADGVGKLRDLFATLTKLSISYFNNIASSGNLRLFYPVSILEKNMIVKSFSHLNGIKESHIVVVFELGELSNRMVDLSDIVDSIRNIKEHDIEVALLINQKELILPVNLVRLFDYFIIDETFANLSKKDNNIRVMVHSLIERLKVYSMPIIVIDADTWNTIDFMAKLGVEVFSSDVLAPYSEKLGSVDKKVLLKLSQMNE